MATVSFNLKDPKGKEETSIRMVFAFGKKIIRISTSMKVLPANWNFSKKRVKQSYLIPNAINFNNRLEAIKNQVLGAYNDHLNKNGTLYQDKFKTELKALLRPSGETSAEKMTFTKGAREYHRICGKKTWTKKHYMTTINVLETYEKENKTTLQFEDIDMTFYHKFVSWCEDKGYALNTIGSHIKEVKVFMNHANDVGWTTHTGHMHKKFKVLEETADSIYLNEKELEAIYIIDLKDPTLGKVRDLFIIGAYTGLRYQDLAQLTKEKFIRNRTMLKVITEKTGEAVVIPLHPYVIEIIEKYNGHTPIAFSDQEMNRSLKVIAREAKLTEKVSKSITRRGTRVSSTVEKYKLVTVHTARRSFATNAYLAGVATLSIMKLTGHRTERSFLKYIKITAEQNAELLSQHSFFKLKVV